MELALRHDAATVVKLKPVWRSLRVWDRHRLAEIDAEIRGDVYTTDDPDWNLLVALEGVRFKDPAILRGAAAVGSLLASSEQALVKTGLTARITELGTGGPRYPEPGPTRRELLSVLGSG